MTPEVPLSCSQEPAIGPVISPICWPTYKIKLRSFNVSEYDVSDDDHNNFSLF
jgi:hypothetical protein